MKIMGIDPAFNKKCVYAIVDDNEHILEIGDFDYRDVAKIIAIIHQSPRRGPINMIALESNWLGKNIKTTQQLSEVVGWIQAAAKAYLIRVVMIHPQSWMSKIPGLSKMRGSAREHFIISTAMSYCNGGKRALNIDEAAAVHIAMYQMRRIKAERIKG